MYLWLSEHVLSRVYICTRFFFSFLMYLYILYINIYLVCTNVAQLQSVGHVGLSNSFLDCDVQITSSINPNNVFVVPPRRKTVCFIWSTTRHFNSFVALQPPRPFIVISRHFAVLTVILSDNLFHSYRYSSIHIRPNTYNILTAEISPFGPCMSLCLLKTENKTNIQLFTKTPG